MTSQLLKYIEAAEVQTAAAISAKHAIIQGLKNVIDSIYPVGSIYITTEDTDPAEVFGGTWTAISDTFLLASGSVYPAGTSGGSASITLSVDQMPSHSHTFNATGGADDTIVVSSQTTMQAAGTNFGSTAVAVPDVVGETGEGAAVSIMPPYLAVYVWRRTA